MKENVNLENAQEYINCLANEMPNMTSIEQLLITGELIVFLNKIYPILKKYEDNERKEESTGAKFIIDSLSLHKKKDDIEDEEDK